MRASVIAYFAISVAFVFGAPQPNEENGVHHVTSFSNSLVPKLFKEFFPGKENLVLAPFGLATNLAMVLEGVDSEAAEEMIQALGLQGKSGYRKQLRQGFKSILQEFENGVQEEEAAGTYNRATIYSAAALPTVYQDLLTTYYKANITRNTVLPHNTTAALKFKAVGQIPRTGHVLQLCNKSGLSLPVLLYDMSNRVLEQVLELQSDTGVMSHWKDYHKLAVYTYLSHEASAPFSTHDGRTVEVPMIPQVGVFRSGYFPSLKAHAVELLLQTKLVSLLLVMPDSIDGTQSLLDTLPLERLDNLIKSLPLKEAEVILPQLAILSGDMDFGPFLRQCGLSFIFHPTTEHSKLKNGYVKSIKQNAYFSTSFVAVNSVGAVGSLMHEQSSVNRKKRQAIPELTFNRPFLFFLLHQSSELVLLAGVVQNPTQVPR